MSAKQIDLGRLQDYAEAMKYFKRVKSVVGIASAQARGGDGNSQCVCARLMRLTRFNDGNFPQAFTSR